MAVCYWHTFVWNGFDVFGAGTFGRSWHRDGDAVELAKEKAAVAFEMFAKLGNPYYCFHDRDVAPEGRTLAETNDILDRVVDVLGANMSGMRRYCWAHTGADSDAGPATPPITARTVYVDDVVPALSR